MLHLALGAACIGFAPIFVRVADMGPTLIGIYRCGIATVVLFAFIFFKNGIQAFAFSNGRTLGLAGLAGSLFALDLFVWHRSVLYSGAGLGTILSSTQVLYVAAFGAVVHREKLGARLKSAVFLALTGITLLVRSESPASISPHYDLGILYGVATGIVYASYILTIREMERSKGRQSTESLLTIVSFVAATLLIPVAAYENSLVWLNQRQWTLMIGLAVTAQVMGWMLLTRSLPRLPVSRAGLILNFQPVVSVIAGYFILGEKLSLIQGAGALITLFAVYLGGANKSPRVN